MKARFFLSFAACTVSTAGGFRALAGAEQGSSPGRILQDGGDTCDEATVFVDSLISDLGDPIGGCYDEATTLLRGFPFYSLGGGASVGQAWIYVGLDGRWEIGIIAAVDETTGDVTALKSVCAAAGFLAADVPGPTEAELEGSWECVYFQNGITNRLSGDFTGVECGCGGRTTVTADADSDDGGVDTTAIAIAVLVAIAVLAVVVCACFIRIAKNKKKKADVEGQSPPPLGETVPKEEGLKAATSS